MATQYSYGINLMTPKVSLTSEEIRTPWKSFAKT